MSKLIKDWDELAAIPNESETHILEVSPERDCGWLKAKEDKYLYDGINDIEHSTIYLSTHTFYKEKYKQSSKVLQMCGFDVMLKNWG